MRTHRTLLAVALLLASCGELVMPGNYQANRTIGPAGGTVALGSIRVDIPRDILSRDLNFRLEEVDPAGLPDGALGPIYRLYPEELPGSLAVAGLHVTWSIQLDDLPPDVYFVELSVARLFGGAWLPLDAASLDPITGEVRGISPTTGVFSLLRVAPDAP